LCVVLFREISDRDAAIRKLGKIFNLIRWLFEIVFHWFLLCHFRKWISAPATTIWRRTQ
jgi:hypothetical protein